MDFESLIDFLVKKMSTSVLNNAQTAPLTPAVRKRKRKMPMTTGKLRLLSGGFLDIHNLPDALTPEHGQVFFRV